MIFRRSTDIDSGITRMSRYPFTAATLARPIPAFPLAVVLGTLLGYLAVAHAAGEAIAEKRFYGGDWFSRANSYYYLLTGLGLLLILFIAANVVCTPWSVADGELRLGEC